VKKILILISIVMISLVILASTGARIQMRNGDVIECEINMDNISFITDYGEFKIPVSFVKEIVFPAPGSMATTLSTVYENETFSGFLLDEYITLEFEGSPLKFHKDFISRIEMYNQKQTVNQSIVHVTQDRRSVLWRDTIYSSHSAIIIRRDKDKDGQPHKHGVRRGWERTYESEV